VQWEAGRSGGRRPPSSRASSIIASRHQLLEDGMRPHLLRSARTIDWLIIHPDVGGVGDDGQPCCRTFDTELTTLDAELRS
jgi:hypothetical protein